MPNRNTNVHIPKGFDLAGLRANAGLTLAQLWKRSKIPYSKLARIEHGEPAELTQDEVARLAKAIKVPDSVFTARIARNLIIDREVAISQQGVGRRVIDEQRSSRIERFVDRLTNR